MLACINYDSLWVPVQRVINGMEMGSSDAHLSTAASTSTGSLRKTKSRPAMLTADHHHKPSVKRLTLVPLDQTFRETSMAPSSESTL